MYLLSMIYHTCAFASQLIIGGAANVYLEISVAKDKRKVMQVDDPRKLPSWCPRGADHRFNEEVQFNVRDRDRSIVLTVRDMKLNKIVAESKLPIRTLKQKAWCKTYKKALYQGDVLIASVVFRD